MGDNNLRRRTVLRGIGGTGIAGALAALGVSGTAAAQSAAARAERVEGEAFLGGGFLELGIRANGGFGTVGDAPSAFFGSERGPIGLYAAYDGFDTGGERYEYFIPDEQFLVGYIPQDGDGELASIPRYRVNGVIDGGPVRTMGTLTGPTAATSGTEATSRITNDISRGGEQEGSEPERLLEVDQTHTVGEGDRYFRTDVTIENVGGVTLDDVRFARTTNPTYRTDVDCVAQPGLPAVEEGVTLVEAAAGGDGCPPLYYYSTDGGTRGFVDVIPPDGLYPERGAIGPPVSEENPEGPQLPGDDGPILLQESETPEGSPESYMGIVFEAGTLEPGQTASVTYYTVLARDIDSARAEIDGEGEGGSGSGSSDEEAEFSLVCDRSGCPDETIDGAERVELSEESPDPGEEIELSVTVTNVGEAEGVYVGELSDGFELYGLRRVELDEGEKATLVYPVTFENAGTYQMFLSGDKIVDVTVGDIPGA
jgi:hypothetical protein